VSRRNAVSPAHRDRRRIAVGAKQSPTQVSLLPRSRRGEAIAHTGIVITTIPEGRSNRPHRYRYYHDPGGAKQSPTQVSSLPRSRRGEAIAHTGIVIITIREGRSNRPHRYRYYHDPGGAKQSPTQVSLLPRSGRGEAIAHTGIVITTIPEGDCFAPTTLPHHRRASPAPGVPIPGVAGHHVPLLAIYHRRIRKRVLY
jgi:hypothetical protein